MKKSQRDPYWHPKQRESQSLDYYKEFSKRINVVFACFNNIFQHSGIVCATTIPMMDLYLRLNEKEIVNFLIYLEKEIDFVENASFDKFGNLLNEKGIAVISKENLENNESIFKMLGGISIRISTQRNQITTNQNMLLYTNNSTKRRPKKENKTIKKAQISTREKKENIKNYNQEGRLSIQSIQDESNILGINPAENAQSTLPNNELNENQTGKQSQKTAIKKRKKYRNIAIGIGITLGIVVAIILSIYLFRNSAAKQEDDDYNDFDDKYSNYL